MNAIRCENLLGVDIRDKVIADLLESRSNVAQLEAIEDRIYIEAEDQGISLMSGPDYKIDTIHLYGPNSASPGYLGRLPLGLAFSLSRGQVRGLLGAPDADSKPAASVLWDRFSQDGFAVHVQYREQGQAIEMVSIMKLSVLPA